MSSRAGDGGGIHWQKRGALTHLRRESNAAIIIIMIIIFLTLNGFCTRSCGRATWIYLARRAIDNSALAQLSKDPKLRWLDALPKSSGSFVCSTRERHLIWIRMGSKVAISPQWHPPLVPIESPVSIGSNPIWTWLLFFHHHWCIATKSLGTRDVTNAGRRVGPTTTVCLFERLACNFCQLRINFCCVRARNTCFRFDRSLEIQVEWPWMQKSPARVWPALSSWPVFFYRERGRENQISRLESYCCCCCCYYPILSKRAKVQQANLSYSRDLPS